MIFNLWDFDTETNRFIEGDQNKKHLLYQLVNIKIHKGIPTGYLFCTSKTEVSFNTTDSVLASVNMISILKNSNISETINLLFCKVDSNTFYLIIC